MSTRNMFNVLYHRYIDQIKEEQIQKYDSKHEAYLKRAGMMQKVTSYHQKQNIRGKDNLIPKRQKQTQQPYRQPKYDKPLVLNEEAHFDDYPVKSGHWAEQAPISTVKARNERSQAFNIQQVPQIQRPIHTKLAQVPEEFQVEKITLIECPEGCGRKFKQQTLEKHIKVCKKIFQEKRKPFKVNVVDDQALKINKSAQASGGSTTKNNTKNTKSDKSKVPKWKKQSEQFRKQFGDKSKKNEGQANGKGANNKIEQQEYDDRIQCSGCGRKFNQKAAERHIPICTKNKQRR